MTDLEKILITAGLTVSGGVIVFVVGQLLSKILIEPSQDLKRIIAETHIALAVHAPTIHTPISRTKETSIAASDALRKCSAELYAKVHAIPGYRVLSFVTLRFLPRRGSIENAVRELRSLSTYVFESGEKALGQLETIQKIVSRIECDLEFDHGA